VLERCATKRKILERFTFTGDHLSGETKGDDGQTKHAPSPRPYWHRSDLARHLCRSVYVRTYTRRFFFLLRSLSRTTFCFPQFVKRAFISYWFWFTSEKKTRPFSRSFDGATVCYIAAIRRLALMRYWRKRDFFPPHTCNACVLPTAHNKVILGIRRENALFFFFSRGHSNENKLSRNALTEGVRLRRCSPRPVHRSPCSFFSLRKKMRWFSFSSFRFTQHRNYIIFPGSIPWCYTSESAAGMRAMAVLTQYNTAMGSRTIRDNRNYMSLNSLHIICNVFKDFSFDISVKIL